MRFSPLSRSKLCSFPLRLKRDLDQSAVRLPVSTYCRSRPHSSLSTRSKVVAPHCEVPARQELVHLPHSRLLYACTSCPFHFCRPVASKRGITRYIAGCLRFFTLTQCLDRPA
jgi:hypothetical protein